MIKNKIKYFLIKFSNMKYLNNEINENVSQIFNEDIFNEPLKINKNESLTISKKLY